MTLGFQIWVFGWFWKMTGGECFQLPIISVDQLEIALWKWLGLGHVDHPGGLQSCFFPCQKWSNGSQFISAIYHWYISGEVSNLNRFDSLPEMLTICHSMLGHIVHPPIMERTIYTHDVYKWYTYTYITAKSKGVNQNSLIFDNMLSSTTCIPWFPSLPINHLPEDQRQSFGMEHMRPPNVRANWHALLEEVSREKAAMAYNARRDNTHTYEKPGDANIINVNHPLSS